MRLAQPLALLLLLLLPVAAALGWPARGYGRRREIASLILRLLLLLCLILALAGLHIRRQADNLAVVFLLDVSDSMPETAQAAALDYVAQALPAMGPDDQAAIIAFGGEALVERSMSNVRALAGVRSIPSTNQTDLAEAIQLALALYPPDAARRMVILSDGAATTGDAQAAARLAAASGVEIVVVPFVVTPGAEVLLSEVEIPDHLTEGERFDLSLTLQATQPTQAGVRVLAGGQVVYEGEYQVERGTQTLNLPLTAGSSGFASYQVQIIPASDTYYQNNELAAYTQVAGPPKILLVAPPEGEAMGSAGQTRPDEAMQLRLALEAAGFIVEAVRPSGLPSELALLAEYASLVLVDVPARQLSDRQMEAVQTYVRDLGGGLVVVGGPTSYGVGGYFRTPLEETLPVDMQIKDQQRRPSLAIVFIIDHSGSMSETNGGVTKLELAKEAAMRSIELLAPTDRVGVIAFDDLAAWVVPMTSLDDPDAVINAIGTIQIGGGTDILAGVQAMANVLPTDPALVRHVILLTDGGADPTGIPDLVSRLYNEYGITLTTVGVGRDAAPFLPQLAELGGGRYHFTDNPASIPSIFTEETTLATRAYIVEETFYPSLVNASPILAGITEVPPLHGYVGASTKEAAQTILVSHLDDPILAAWQYGLGRAVAFTSDASGRWAQDWVGWQGFATFWAQAVRYTIGERSSSPLEVSIETEGEQALLVVDAQQYALNGNGGSPYLNGYTMQANVIAPDGQTTTLELQQIAPGRYQASFTPGQQGAYLVRIAGSPPADGEAVAETAGWVLSYSPEYRQLDSDPDALYRLALANGGHLATADPAEAFAHTLTAVQSARPAWTWLLALAAILLPFDIAVRRLVLTWSDLRRGWEKLAARIQTHWLWPGTWFKAGRQAQAADKSGARPGTQVGSLLQAKERTRKTRSQPGPLPGKESGPSQPPQAPTPPRPGALPPSQPTQRPPRTQVSQPAKPQTPQPPTEQASTAARLLARKRARQEPDDKEPPKA